MTNNSEQLIVENSEMLKEMFNAVPASNRGYVVALLKQKFPEFVFSYDGEILTIERRKL